MGENFNLFSKKLALVVCLLGIVQNVLCAYDPCANTNGKIGSACDYDFDCSGFGVVCKLGQCDCHYNYQVKTDTDGSKYCAKLPDTINAPCTDNCRFPMFCNNGKCQCIRAKADGNRCSVSSKVGDPCTKHTECSQPFSACNNGKCSCIAGTNQNGNSCQAQKRCPDGGQPKNNCVRTTYDITYIQNQFNSSSVDTCDNGYYCYTSDVSLGGHCCPQMCPLNTQPDTGYSCTPGTSRQCPQETHFCHRLAGQSFSSGVCCRRPCKEPTPVYINGKCYARAWLGSPCASSEQCNGNDDMQCTNGQCVCKSGYKPQTGSYITGENPPQFCIKDCGSNLDSRGGDCFANVNLGQQCDVDDQCPSNARCFRGTCTCKCDAGYSKSGNSCQKLTTTTPRSGVTNSGQGGLINLVDNLFKGGKLG